jgi:hypothetical protein
MARLSDFTIPSRGRNLVAEALVDRNAQAIRNVTRFSDTRIEVREGAVESQPYGRDAAIAGFNRRKKLHGVLDAMCCSAGMTEAEATPVHDALDRHLDESGEPEEEDDDEEEIEDGGEKNEKHEHVSIPAQDMHRALDAIMDLMERRKKTRRTSRDHSSGYITDSDFIARYLNPNELCVEASNKLRPRVMENQEDNAMRGYWAGLFDFLRSQPEGSRIRDCRRATLSTLISKTLAA